MRRKKSYKWPNEFHCSGQMVLTISLQILVRCWPNKLNIVIIQVSLSKSLQIYLFLEPVIDEEIKQIVSNFKNKQKWWLYWYQYVFC